MRRAIKFNYSNKTILKTNKLCEENNLTSLHEIFDQLMLENGLDSDLSTMLYLTELKKLEEAGEDVIKLDEAATKDIHQRVYYKMKVKVERHLLTSYF
jgi:hypothetical protein